VVTTNSSSDSSNGKASSEPFRQVRADPGGDPFGEPLENVVGEGQSFPGDVDVRHEVLAGKEPKVMEHATLRRLADLLDNPDFGDQLGRRHGEQAQFVRPPFVQEPAVQHGGKIEQTLVVVIGARFHVGDPVGERAVEFEVDRARQRRQLFGVRIQARVALDLLHDLELVQVD
jgi:hypothetical protein